MLIALGASLRATTGAAAPEIEQTYLRAQHLCEFLDDPHQLSCVLYGLSNYYLTRTELQTAHALGTQLLTLAQQVQDAAMRVAAHRAVGATLLWLGDTVTAHAHFTQGMALYDPSQHHATAFLYSDDSGVVCHIHAAWALWYLGYPAQGLARSQEAVTLAQQSAHPFSLNFVLVFAAVFHQLRRDGRATQECAEAAMRLAMEQGFPLLVAYSSILRGWALVQQGQAQERIEQIIQGLMTYRAT